MGESNYNVLMGETGVPVKAWTKGVPVGRRRSQAIAERRAAAFSQVDCRYAGCPLGRRCNRGQRHSH